MTGNHAPRYSDQAAAIRPAKFRSRSFGVAAARAKTVHEATDLLRHGLASGAPMLIDVVLDREFK